MNTAVVTGGARGIGRAVASALVQRGYQVVLTDVDADGARRTAEEIGAVAGVAHDVRQEAAHAAVAQRAATYGPLKVWVNNAGVGHDGTLAGLTSEHLQQVVEVNLLGVMWGMRAALAAFGPAGGDIVNIASLSGLGPVPGLSVYAATKAAVVSLTTSVHVEAPRGVRVHAVCPDGVDTALVASMDEQGMGRALVNSGGRLLTVEEVASAAVGLIGSRRVVRALPGWRGGLVRFGSVTPAASAGLYPVMAAIGRRSMRRR